VCSLTTATRRVRILWNGTLRYALEVKRPNGNLDAFNVVRKAARQIRDPRFHGGVIVVDLTDCIDAGLRLHFGSGAPGPNPVHERVHELMGDLHREIFADGAQRLRRNREHVFSLICFARSTYWDLSSLRFPYLSRYVGTVDYWRNDPGTPAGASCALAWRDDPPRDRRSWASAGGGRRNRSRRARCDVASGRIN
jgi:hypothetical protein